MPSPGGYGKETRASPPHRREGHARLLHRAGQKRDKLGMRGSNTCEWYPGWPYMRANTGKMDKGTAVLMSGLGYGARCSGGARHHGA